MEAFYKFMILTWHDIRVAVSWSISRTPSNGKLLCRLKHCSYILEREKYNLLFDFVQIGTTYADQLIELSIKLYSTVCTIRN
jgi:hypothetical protein